MLMIVVMVVIGPLHGESRRLTLAQSIRISYRFSSNFHFVAHNIFLGEMSVFYLFTRYKFNWSEVEFSIFSTYSMLTGLVGNILQIFRMNAEIFPIISI